MKLISKTKSGSYSTADDENVTRLIPQINEPATAGQDTRDYLDEVEKTNISSASFVVHSLLVTNAAINRTIVEIITEN